MKKIVSTFGQVNVSNIEAPVIVIYNSPEEYKGYFVAKLWDLDKPTDTLMIKKTLSEIREDIKTHFPIMSRLPRLEIDDICIVETWM